MRARHVLRWALCFFCNGNGCRECGNTGEVMTHEDRAGLV